MLNSQRKNKKSGEEPFATWQNYNKRINLGV
jgi:hypothetical protein